MPLKMEAGFFSSILGNEVSADVMDSLNSAQVAENSQTLTLLEADISSISTSQDKKDEIESDIDVNIVSENALFPTTSHISVPGEIEAGDPYSDQISVYVVRKGDSISQIADMFGVSVDTILSVNEMEKSDKLKEGDVLLILPFSGIEHVVTKGQTLQGIANLYKIEIDEIFLANDIDTDAKLVVGEKLMIPGADMLNETESKTGSNITKGSNSYSSMPSIVGYFKNPVPNGKKSRGVTSKHKGVDIAAPTGTPIYASASGRVLVARMGWNGAYGNMAILQHSNGTRTLYAHMSKLGTTTGAQVSQGEVIGYVGSTGRSTGPHLHFEVLGAKNPF